MQAKSTIGRALTTAVREQAAMFVALSKITTRGVVLCETIAYENRMRLADFAAEAAKDFGFALYRARVQGAPKPPAINAAARTAHRRILDALTPLAPEPAAERAHRAHRDHVAAETAARVAPERGDEEEMFDSTDLTP